MGQPTGNMGYAYYQGTSMAAPHVAGIVALMLARNASLGVDQVKSILQQTVTPFPGGSTCNTNICGTGIANARSAVLAVPASSGASLALARQSGQRYPARRRFHHRAD